MDFAFLGIYGRVFLGMILFIYVASYRKDFLGVVKNNSLSVISLNSLNEVIFIIADSVACFALLLAPVTLVMTVNGMQPVFVLIFGVILTLLFPKIFKESLLKKNIIQKIIAVLLVTVGACMLSLTGAL